MTTPETPLLVDAPLLARDMAAALDRLLDQRLAQQGLSPHADDALRRALVQIGARFGETLVRCVNAAPALHLRAFSALLGGRPRPAQAAQVHLVFKPAAGRSAEPVVVPRHTRVAATAPPGESQRVIFETQADLFLVRAWPACALWVDAGHRHRLDVPAIVQTPAAQAGAAPAEAMVEQALYIGDRRSFGIKGLRQIKLHVEVLDPGVRDAATTLQWCVPGAAGDQPLVVESDGTGGLTRSGSVVLKAPAAWALFGVGGVQSLWLALKAVRATDVLPLRLAEDEDGTPLQREAPRPPRLAALRVQAIAATEVEALAAASHDGAPLDISKDAYPFGTVPRFGSSLALTSPVFQPGARVELLVRLTNPEGPAPKPIPAVKSEGRPSVVWEISTTKGFEPLGASDGTRSFTRDGSVMFTVPDNVATLTVAGVQGVWLRAWLASGDWGIDAAPGKAGEVGMTVPRSPSIRKMAVRSTLETGAVPVEHLFSQGALRLLAIDPRQMAPFDAFVAPDTTDDAALYIGLDAIPGALARGRVLSWHVLPQPAEPPLAVTDAARPPVPLRWQMHAADGWHDVPADDDSAGGKRSGIVRLVLPAEPAPWIGNTLDSPARLAWLRLLMPTTAALPARLSMNSVAARQSQLIRNEIVGSSNGRTGQLFKSLRTPIIGSVRLQVRETPTDWTAWNEVESLSGSQATDRVFTLDRSSGEIRFGDGRCGRIPPAGASNVRLHRYTIGGGQRGNRPAGSITQLLTAVPAVESVVNAEPAGGGLDAEPDSRVRAQAFAWLRHRDRAVCADDFADLALQASPEVARAYCVPGRDLSVAEPLLADSSAQQALAGAVPISLVVLPHGEEREPQPGLPLLAGVKAWLDARRAPGGRLVVVGPRYVPVSVRVTLSAEAELSPHELGIECRRRIERFLHPLHGNVGGSGWRLGQKPHRSDLYAELGLVDGVQAVSALSLRFDTPAGVPFIVCAGAVEMTIESAG